MNSNPIQDLVEAIENLSENELCYGTIITLGKIKQEAEAIYAAHGKLKKIVDKPQAKSDYCDYEAIDESCCSIDFKTDCNKYVTFEKTDPFKFCPYCGKRIKIIK